MWGDIIDSIKLMAEDENYLLAAYSGLLLSKSHSYSFLADSLSEAGFPKVAATRTKQAHQHLCEGGAPTKAIKDNCNQHFLIYIMKA